MCFCVYNQARASVLYVQGGAGGPARKKATCIAPGCTLPQTGAHAQCSYHLSCLLCVVCRRYLRAGLFDDDTNTCNACVRKMQQTGEGVSTSVHGTFATKTYDDLNFSDVLVSFDDMRDELTQYLQQRLATTAVVVYIGVQVVMRRHVDGEFLDVLTSFTSNPTVLTDADAIAELLAEARATIVRRIEAFVQMGSGWMVYRVTRVQCKTATYNPVGGSSHIPTPKAVSHAHAVVNVQNKDPYCFVWSILAALHPARQNTMSPTCHQVQKILFHSKETRIEA